MNPRITLNDSLQKAIIQLAEGIPGAITVLVELAKNAPHVDPQSAMGNWGPLLDLDSNAIYGSRIWMLYKDLCKEDIVSTIVVLRAVQLGVISESVLNHAIDNRGDGLKVEDVVAAVKEKVTINAT